MSENKILYLSSEDVQKSVNMNEAIDAMESAFVQLSSGEAKVPLRSHIDIESENAGALFMPVYLPKNELIGLKTVTIFRDNNEMNLPFIHALVMVLDGKTGEPTAFMNGELLTAIRTGAASGLATKLLSSQDAKTGALIGAGVQGEKQIEAVCCVRDIKRFYIFDLELSRAEKFATKLRDKMNCEFIATDERALLKEADVICTATSSPKPVVNLNEISEGVHINGIGSYRPDMCEIAPAIMGKSNIVVDSRAACLAEAGDIIEPKKLGLVTDDMLTEIGELVKLNNREEYKGKDFTVFKSVGNAVQDLAVSDVIIKNALNNGLGTFLKL